MATSTRPVRSLRSSKSMTSLSQLAQQPQLQQQQEAAMPIAEVKTEVIKVKKQNDNTPSSSLTDSDNSDTIVKEYRERLVLLHHASYCEHSNAYPPRPCRVTPNCLDILMLLQHVTECKTPMCKEVDCATTKFLRTHFQQCKVFKCSICTPLHQSINRKRQQEESYHVQQTKRRCSFDNTTGDYSTFRKLSDETNPEEMLRSMGIHVNCGMGRRTHSTSELMHCYELEPGTFPPFFTKPLFIHRNENMNDANVCSPLTISENDSDSSLSNPMPVKQLAMTTAAAAVEVQEDKTVINQEYTSPQKTAFYIPHPAHFVKSTSSNSLVNAINLPITSTNHTPAVVQNMSSTSLDQLIHQPSPHKSKPTNNDNQRDVFNAIVDFMDEVTAASSSDDHQSITHPFF